MQHAMEKEKILVVTQHFWPETFRINDVVEGFLSDGLEVDVLCGLPNYPKGEWFEGYHYTGPRRQNWKGAHNYRAGEIPRKGNTGLRIFLNYVSWPFFALFNLHRLPGGYDAILCYNTSPVLMDLPAIVYAKLHHIPHTNYVLDLWPENLYSVLPVKNRFLRAVALKVSDWHYRRADKLIAMSDGLKNNLLRRTGKPAERIAVIPQYCEDFYAHPLPDPELEAWFAGRFNLVFAGNFSPAQSLDTLIRAAAAAHSLPGGESLHLLLVGDGMSRQELEALTDQLDARSFITFWGSVPPTEIPRFSHLAGALAVSLSDSPDLGLTVPAKVASCLAAGKPVLGSLNGEGARALTEAGSGPVCPACDTESLAQAILQLCRSDAAQREAWGRNARAYYESHYRRSELLRRLEAFILE